MAFPDSMCFGKPSKNNVCQWLGFAFASLAFALPMAWFMSKGTINWMAPIMFVLFLLGVGKKTPHIYYKDRLILLCTLLALMVVAGYIWQRFSVPEALLGNASVKEYITAFCFFVVVAYGISAAPKVSPFLLLVSAGAGLLVHLSSLPVDVWLDGWQGHRLDFGFRNAQHTSIIFATALLASVFFLPRALSLPFRARMLALPLLVSFIPLMIFGVITTQTRAAWLGLIFSAITLLLLCAVVLFAGCRSVRWHTLIRIAATGIYVLLVGSATLYFMPGNITQRVSEEKVGIATIKETARLETVPRTSITVRIGTWSAAREWIAERPVFGWGGNTAAKLIKQSPHFDEEFSNNFGHLHNSYLETLVAVGGAAFICMLAIVFLLAWRTFALWRQGQIPTDVFLFSWVFFSFWVTVNMFESYIQYDYGTFLNAVIGGFLYSWYLRRQYDQAELKKECNSSIPKQFTAL
jgi:O-antigen ligase